MTLAQVQAVVALIAALILSWAALLMAVALTLPEQTNRAEDILETQPKKCFGVGLGMAVALIAGLFTLRIPGVQLFGILFLLTLAAVFVVGAAGLAKLMGSRIAELSGWKGNSFSNLAKGSLVYSAAMLFPLIGWYLFLPLSMLGAMGAGLLAVWPKRKTAPIAPLSNQPTMDVA